MNFKEPIRVIYPPNNFKLFEQWFDESYKWCNTDRELLPVYFNGFYVNNNYGNDLEARKELQSFLYSLDRNKKWFTIIQYDDSILDDVSHLDLLRFEMSKNIGVPIPLLCQPHPYKFIGGKKWFGSFVGSRTHPIRNNLESLKGKEGYYISFEFGDIETYCRVLHESMFSLCPRGYGANSFRIAESIQFGSIPVYISNEFILPFNIDFEEFGVLIKEEDAGIIHEILSNIEPEEVIRKQDRLKEVYEKYYTYEGCFSQIIKHLETEYAPKG